MIALLKSSWGSRNSFWNCALTPSPLKKRQPWMFSSLRVWSWSCHILKAVVIHRVLWTGIEMSGFLCHLSGCMWVCHAPVEAGVSLVFDIQQREQPPTKLAKSKVRGLHSVLTSLPNFTDIRIIFLRGLCSLDVPLPGGRHNCRPSSGWAQVSSLCWPWIPTKLNFKFPGHADSAATTANKSQPSGEIWVYLVCAKDRPSSSQRFRAQCTVNIHKSKRWKFCLISQKHWY